MPMPRLKGRRSPRFTSCRLAPLVAVAMLLIVVTTGCVGQRDPSGYGDSVRKNFVDGCTAAYVTPGHKDPQAAAHRKFCGCLYEQLSNKRTGISFDDFKSAQSKIRKDPTDPANTIEKLIPKFSKFEAACRAKTEAGPTAGGS